MDTTYIKDNYDYETKSFWLISTRTVQSVSVWWLARWSYILFSYTLLQLLLHVFFSSTYNKVQI